jgi:imidazolonepropionase-like amidohydrolase
LSLLSKTSPLALPRTPATRIDSTKAHDLMDHVRPSLSARFPSRTPESGAGQQRVVPTRLQAVCLLIALVSAGVGLSVGPAARVAAEEPFVAPALLLRGAKVWDAATGEFLPREILLRGPLIEAVAESIPQPPDADLLTVEGLLAYPGFVDAGTSRFLKGEPPLEPGRKLDVSRSALAATPVDQHKGLTPEYHPAESLDTTDEAIPKWREAGWLTVQALPTHRIASGRAAVFATSGLPPREALLERAGLGVFSLAPLPGPGYPTTRMGTAAHLRQALLDAQHDRQQRTLYDQKTPGIERPHPDRVLAALAEHLEHRRTLLLEADSRDDILRALEFASEWKLPVAIWGGRDADQCVTELLAAEAPVLLTLRFGEEPKVEPESSTDPLVPDRKEPLRLQQYERDDWRRRAAVAKVLAEKGVVFALASEGNESPGDFRKALKAALKQGLTEQQALKALTQTGADLAGQGRRLGSIEPGKLATFFLTKSRLSDDDFKLDSVFLEGQRTVITKPTPAAETTPSGSVPSLGGEWLVTIDSGDPKLEATLELIQQDNKLSGVFRSPQGEGKLTSGEVKGKSLSFAVAIGAGLQTLELKFEGTTEGDATDQLKGTLRSAFGAPTPWNARRKAKPPAVANATGANPPPANPVALSLDKDDTPKPPAVPGTTPTPSDPSVTAPATDWPVELPSDRIYTGLKTGGNVYIDHATIITVSGETLADASLLVTNGKIAAVWPAGTVGPIPADITRINATGKYLIPGIIDTHSHIMFREQLGGVNEATLSIVPEVRVRDAIRSDDPAAFRALAGGVTTIRLLHGSANVIGGQDAVVKLKYGRPVSELLFPGAHQGVKFALGENVKFQSGRFPNTRLGVEATLQRAFFEAWDYRRKWQAHQKLVEADGPDKVARLAPRRDLRLETLADILDQKTFIHSHCYRNDEILMLLRVASGFGVRVWSLQHVLEGYKVGPEIAAHKASASLFSDWWAYKLEAYDAIPQAPQLMHDAGVSVCLKSDDAELMRHLYQDAAKTLRYGPLTPETALRFITLNPAAQLGIEQRVGSIEVGKDADLALFSGHPLNAQSRCEMTLIDGEVWFQRDRLPSAMLPASATASAKAGPLVLAAPELRDRTLTLPENLGSRYALVNAVIHSMEGGAYDRGNIVINNGRIEAIGREIAVPDGVPALLLGGLHVWPGLIDAGCVVGLYEIGKARETLDYAETGAYQPDIRAAVAVNPDSELIAVTRAGGITTCLIRPTGGVIAGQASHLQLTGWTAPEMTRDYEVGLRINWPTGKENQKEIDALVDFLDSARRYLEVKARSEAAKTPGPLADPRFDALTPYLAGKKPVLIAAHGRREIVQAIQFAEKQKLKLILTGASDAWKLAETLKQKNIPLIIGPVMKGFVTAGNQPSMSDHDPFDAYYANPGRLHAAGVPFAFQSDDAANSRNLPFEAAMAVSYGLPEEAALHALTLGAAKVLGLDSETGSLVPGKRADLIITDGSPIQPATRIKAIGINGTLHPPTSRHTKLYDKYRARPTK